MASRLAGTSTVRTSSVSSRTPYVLGAITVTCGVASATLGGGNLFILSVIATLSAGSGTSLAHGWIVAGLGAAAVASAGPAAGANLPECGNASFSSTAR
jgi:hypothetical protein